MTSAKSGSGVRTKPIAAIWVHVLTGVWLTRVMIVHTMVATTIKATVKKKMGCTVARGYKSAGTSIKSIPNQRIATLARMESTMAVTPASAILPSG